MSRSDTEAAVDVVLRWIALRPRRWAQLVILAEPQQSPQFQAALQPTLAPVEPALRGQIMRAA